MIYAVFNVVYIWVQDSKGYCKFTNVLENFIFPNNGKRHVCDYRAVDCWASGSLIRDSCVTIYRSNCEFL